MIRGCTGALERTDAMDGCDDSVIGLVSRVLFSEVYMTATLVDGESIVPVSDQPIAMTNG